MVHTGHKPSRSEKPTFFPNKSQGKQPPPPGIYTVFILYKNKAFCEQSEASSVCCLLFPTVLNFRQTFKHQCLFVPPETSVHTMKEWPKQADKLWWHVKSYPLVKSSTLRGAGLMRSEAHTIWGPFLQHDSQLQLTSAKKGLSTTQLQPTVISRQFPLSQIPKVSAASPLTAKQNDVFEEAGEKERLVF